MPPETWIEKAPQFQPILGGPPIKDYAVTSETNEAGQQIFKMKDIEPVKPMQVPEGGFPPITEEEARQQDVRFEEAIKAQAQITGQAPPDATWGDVAYQTVGPAGWAEEAHRLYSGGRGWMKAHLTPYYEGQGLEVPEFETEFDAYMEELRQSYAKIKDTDVAKKVFRDVASGFRSSISAIGAGAAVGTATLNPVAATATALGIMGVTTFGNQFERFRDEGFDFNNAYYMAAAHSAAEVLPEMIPGFGSTNRILRTAMRMPSLRRSIFSSANRQFIKSEATQAFLSEFKQEGTTGFFQNLYDWRAGMKPEDYGKADLAQDAIYEGIIGAVSAPLTAGAIGGVQRAAVNAFYPNLGQVQAQIELAMPGFLREHSLSVIGGEMLYRRPNLSQREFLAAMDNVQARQQNAIWYAQDQGLQVPLSEQAQSEMNMSRGQLKALYQRIKESDRYRIDPGESIIQAHDAWMSGQISSGTYQTVLDVVESDPTLQGRAAITFVDELKRTDDGQFVAGEYAPADAATGKAMVRIFTGGEADTIIHEWHHDLWENLSEADQVAYQTWYEALPEEQQDPGGVQEHFANTGMAHTLAQGTYLPEGLQRLFNHSRDALQATVGHVQRYAEANIPVEIANLFGTIERSPDRSILDPNLRTGREETMAEATRVTPEEREQEIETDRLIGEQALQQPRQDLDGDPILKQQVRQTVMDQAKVQQQTRRRNFVNRSLSDTPQEAAEGFVALLGATSWDTRVKTATAKGSDVHIVWDDGTQDTYDMNSLKAQVLSGLLPPPNGVIKQIDSRFWEFLQVPADAYEAVFKEVYGKNTGINDRIADVLHPFLNFNRMSQLARHIRLEWLMSRRGEAKVLGKQMRELGVKEVPQIVGPRYQLRPNQIDETVGGIRITNLRDAEGKSAPGLIGYQAESNLDYQGGVIELSPLGFLELALYIGELGYAESRVKEIRDLIKDKGMAPPWLALEWNDEHKYWEVAGHEGRHRMKALQSMGISENVPITLRFRDVKEPYGMTPVQANALAMHRIVPEGWDGKPFPEAAEYPITVRNIFGVPFEKIGTRGLVPSNTWAASQWQYQTRDYDPRFTTDPGGPGMWDPGVEVPYTHTVDPYGSNMSNLPNWVIGNQNVRTLVFNAARVNEAETQHRIKKMQMEKAQAEQMLSAVDSDQERKFWQAKAAQLEIRLQREETFREPQSMSEVEAQIDRLAYESGVTADNIRDMLAENGLSPYYAVFLRRMLANANAVVADLASTAAQTGDAADRAAVKFAFRQAVNLYAMFKRAKTEQARGLKMLQVVTGKMSPKKVKSMAQRFLAASGLRPEMANEFDDIRYTADGVKQIDYSRLQQVATRDQQIRGQIKSLQSQLAAAKSKKEKARLQSELDAAQGQLPAIMEDHAVFWQQVMDHLKAIPMGLREDYLTDDQVAGALKAIDEGILIGQESDSINAALAELDRRIARTKSDKKKAKLMKEREALSTRLPVLWEQSGIRIARAIPGLRAINMGFNADQATQPEYSVPFQLGIDKEFDKLADDAWLENATEEIIRTGNNPLLLEDMTSKFIKGSFSEFIHAWHINAMLSAISTFGADMGGNALFTALAIPEHYLGAAFGARTLREANTYLYGMVSAIPEAISTYLYNHGFLDDEGQSTGRNLFMIMERGHEVFKRTRSRRQESKSNTFDMSIEVAPGRKFNLAAYLNAPLRQLVATAAAFRVMNYRAKLAEVSLRKATEDAEKFEPALRALGKGKEAYITERALYYKANPMEWMVALAEEEADYRVFEAKPGSFTKAALKVRNLTLKDLVTAKGKFNVWGKELSHLDAALNMMEPGPRKAAVGLISDLLDIKPFAFMIPFVSTPSNIAYATAMERTPLAIFPIAGKALTNALIGKKAMKQAGVAEVVGHIGDDMAKAMIGSLLVGLGLWFASEGLHSGAGPTNLGVRRGMYGAGWQPYAMRATAPNGREFMIQTNRVEPVFTLVGLGADLWESFELEGYDEFGKKLKFWDALFNKRVLTNLFNAAMTASLNKTYAQGLLETAKLFDKRSGPNRWPNYLGRMVGGFVPNIFASGTRAFDSSQRRAEGFLGTIQEKIDPQGNYVPITGRGLPPLTDSWGDEVSRDGLPIWNWLAPARFSWIKEDKLRQSVAEIAYPTPEEIRNLGAYKLTPWEKHDLNVEIGQLAKKWALQQVSQKSWDSRHPEVKAKIFDKIFRKAREVVKAKPKWRDLYIKQERWKGPR